MEEDAVEPQEYAEENHEEPQFEAPQEEEYNEEPQQQPEKMMVPLSALQKERQKKRELELELQFERQRNAQVAPKPQEEDDDSRYESATKEELRHSQEEAIRSMEERLWIRQNPEKYERVNEDLERFLKQRPNLAAAIAQAPNRYEEAFTLMTALSPKQQQQFSKPAQQKKVAPNAPTGVPKAAALNDSVDLMHMNDKEFNEWRNSKRGRR